MPAFAFSRVPHKSGAGAAAIRDKIQYIERTGKHAPAVEYPIKAVQADLRHTETSSLPSWAKDNTDFFIQADRWEGVKRVVFVEWKFDLPKALSHEQHLALTRDFLTTYLGTNHVTTWVKHEPDGLDGTAHPHVHAFWSARPVTGSYLPPSKFFSRKNPKTASLNTAYAAGREKRVYSDVMNLHMEAAGLALRYSPLSYQERGLAMTPEPKALPSDSYRFAHTGKISPRLQKVLDHRKAMEPYKAEEARDAQERWDARKAQLGITPGMSREVALGKIAEGRDVYERTRSRAERTAERRQRSQDIAQQQADIAVKIRLHTRHLHRLTPQPGRVPEEHARGGGYRVKLYEEEKYERDQSRGF